ncbi:MAG: hypothetical protein DSM106950_45350 [Stigonema ocellatum SAG 48.90 = DSM 106950]|nr:hypothetical protein [Stigonema ocellatum SAG 48.90 = DSM 106950]
MSNGGLIASLKAIRTFLTQIRATSIRTFIFLFCNAHDVAIALDATHSKGNTA